MRSICSQTNKLALMCALAVSGARPGTAWSAPDMRTDLETRAAAEFEHVHRFEMRSSFEDELAAARRLVALREQIVAINKPSAANPSPPSLRGDQIRLYMDTQLLGKALYANGRVEEAEVLYTRLAADRLTDATGEYEAAQVLAGRDAEVRKKLGLIGDKPRPSGRHTEKIWGFQYRGYIDALLLRAHGLALSGRAEAAAAAYKHALATWALLEHKDEFRSRLDAIIKAGKDLEMVGDLASASVLFRSAATLAASAFAADHYNNVIARRLSQTGNALRERDPSLTLDIAAVVFPSEIDSVPEAERNEIDSLHLMPTDESMRSDSEVSRKSREHEILAKRLGENHPQTIKLLAILARALNRDGQPAKAADLQTLAVERAAKLLGASNSDVIKFRTSLGSYLEASGRPDEAIAQLTIVATENAASVSAGVYDAMFSTWTLHRLLQNEGRYHEALPYAEALASAAKANPTGSSDDLADDIERYGEPFFALDRVALALSEDLRRLGRFAEAEKWGRTALGSRVKRFGSESYNTDIARLRLATDILSQPSRAAEAYSLVSSSYIKFANLSRKAWSDYESAEFKGFVDARNFASEARPTYLDAAFALYQAKSPEASSEGFLDGAFAALQDSFYSAPALAVAHNAARRYAASVGAGALVARREVLAQSVTLALAAVERAEGPRATVADEDRANAALVAAAKSFTTLDAELNTKAPLYKAIVAQPPLTTAEARQLMQPNEAALIAVPTETGIHLAAVTREAITWRRSSLSANQLSTMVTRLRRDLQPAGPSGGSFDRKTAYALYTALITPLGSALAGKTTVYVVGGGLLATLPLGVLVTEPPAPGSSDADPEILRQTRWFADSFALVQTPSLQALAYGRQFHTRLDAEQRPMVGHVEFAGYGDPELTGSNALRGARTGALPSVDASTLIEQNADRAPVAGAEPPAPLMDPQLLRRLAKLPGTRNELEDMRRALGATEPALHLGAAMRESDFRTADLSHIRILHIATHGLTASESGARAEPGLVFTPPTTASAADDGYLAASEVASLNLSSSDWVILSACNTASSAGAKDSSGLSGLARAFLFAGARSLLVSHWPVYDAVAARLTVDALRREQVPGVSRAQALQQAMRAVREDRSDPALAHPAAWAPFALVGEGR